MNIEFKKYKEYLAMAKDAIEKVKIPFKVLKEKKQLELKILELESEIATTDVELQDIFTNKENIDWEDVMDQIDDKELNERKLKQLQELKEQLF